MEGFYRGLDPYIKEARQFGLPPEQYIANVMESERKLRASDLPSRFSALMAIADQYNIPLRDVINQSVGEQVLKSPQTAAIPQEIQRELAEIRQWRNQQEQNTVDTAVNHFSTDKEFFSDVRGAMADLIESGQASSLQDAYDKAVWIVPEVREVIINRRISTPAKDTRATKVVARQLAASKVSIPSGGKVDVSLDEDDSDDVASTVRKAMASSLSGRA